VSAALAISAADVVPVVGDPKQAPFKLSTLTELYRTVSLARALGISTADLAILRTFIAPDPFNSSTPGAEVKDATDFVRLARQLLAANLSLAQLDYLFHDAVDAGSGLEIAVGTIAATVDQLRAGLKTIAAALAVDENDPNVAAVVRRKLALLLTPAQLNGAIAILEGAPGADYTKVDDDFGVLRTVAPTLDLTPLKSPPADTQPSTIAARYALIRQPLLDYVADRDRHALVRAQVAAAFSVSLPIAVALLDSPFVAPLPATPGTAPLDVLLDPIMLGSDPTLDPTNPDPKTSKLAAQLATVTLLYKQATLATLLKLGADELVFMVAHDDKLGWVDLRLLPIDGLSTTIGDDQLRGLFDYLQLRKRQPPNAPPLLDVFDRAVADASATVDDLLVDIAKRTGWGEPVNGVAPDLHALATAFGFTTVGQFVNEQPLVKLAPAVELLTRSGAPAAKLLQWAQPLSSSGTPPAFAVASDIRAAAKSKHSASEWLTIAKALRDPLREKQRDALVAYVIANGIPYEGGKHAVANPDELFGWLLVDAEMGACQLTSRIKQAIGATQLFIQRCLLNVEPFSLGPIATRQWIWMRSYSVWAANRLVFLYPENWIEPELRDDKTPFFQDLEHELSQNDITVDTAEQAYRNYLEKLQEVARLEVVGMFDQVDAFDQLSTDAADTNPDATHSLHVIARTYTAPHIYYYRRRERGYLWTPWEKISLDIAGEHVMPVVWNRRLHLFWPIIAEKTDQTTQTATMPDSSKAGSSSPPQQPPRHREIQLAWSEYKENKWQAKKTSKRTLRLDVPLAYSRGMDELDPSDANSLVFFKAELSGTSDDLIIRCVNRNPPDLSQASRQAHGAMSRVQPPPAFSPVASRGPVNMMPKGGPIPKPTPDPPPHNPVQGPPNGGSGNGGVPANNMWQTGYFRFSACSSEPTVAAFATNSVPLVWPINAVMQHQGFRGIRAPVYFNRPFDPRWLTVPPEQREFLQLPYKPQSLYTLGGFLGASYESMYPHRDGQFFFTPFFFADDQRTYFVTRKPPVVLPPPPPPPPVIIYDRRAASIAPKAYLPSAIFDNVARYLRSDLVAAPPLVSSPASIAMTAARPEASSPRSMASGNIYVPPPPVVGPPRDALQFHTFYHPYVCDFLKRLAQYGIDGLLRWDQPPAPLAPQPLQLLGADDFAKNYRPNQLVVATPYPTLEVAFDRCDAYAQYNWELFFHTPFYVANRLSQNQRFEDAMKWYHFIFDPTTDVAHDPSGRGKPACYWKLLPFQEDGTGESIVDILRALASGGEIDDPGSCEWQTLAQRVADWRNDPFSPHLVARERISAYQKAVVIKYLDNLIAWGDQLFRQDTIESINQATQLYVLASEILGPRPQGVPTPPSSAVYTWNDLVGSGHLDPFSDELESYLPQLSPATSGFDFPFSQPPQLVFCVPPNAQLMRYWDTVADRLFKIRHCQNIEGHVQTLPLFEPPLNPALLIAARAGGVDLSTAINDVQAAVPHYRFQVMLQKANELVADLRALGGGLLAALEKKDAEHLTLLRANQETAVLQAMRAVKASAIDEAQHSL
ncbi:MAG TPA: neuraminidase-like domain-containing protein, partial [Polyangia bacterium]